MTNEYNYTGHWEQSESQGGAGGSQKEGMMQRHVDSWREASVDCPARRWRRGCFCSHFLVVGQGLMSVLGDQRPALWRKAPYALGLLSALLKIYMWLDAGFPVLNRSGQRPTKALRLLCCLFHCVSCTVHLQLGDK